MLGWRGRFGYISPSTIQVPWELQDLLPEGVGVVASVLGVRAHQDSEFQRAEQSVEAAIETVVGEGARAVVLAGVPLAVRRGYRQEQEANQRWSQRFGVPVTSAVAAVVAGFRHLGVRRPIVVTAYLEELNRLIAAYLTEAGLEVVGVQGLSVRSPDEASRLEPTVYYTLTRDLAATHPESDCVFLGGRVDLQKVVMRLEQDMGVPVLHGTQAGLWWALRVLGVQYDRPDASRLLASGD